MTKLLLTTLILLMQPTFILLAVDFHDFDAYQEKLTQKEIQKKLESYLEKDPSIRSFYKLTADELVIGKLEEQNIDYTLKLSQVIQPYKKTEKTLKGARIAIDPGHFGGIFSKLEQRFVFFPAQKGKRAISFDEGTLTYLTALKLKSLLEIKGATVFLTKDGIGKGCLEKNFFEWLQEQAGLWSGKESLSEIWRKKFNKIDLEARAEAINAFKPDLTIIIHYNASSYIPNKRAAEQTSNANYNLAFVPGAFAKGDLDSIESRYEFLRLIVTQDCEESIKLSQHITSQFTKQLKVPLIFDTEKDPYEPNLCLKQENGIYARNLFLTRSVHGPLCYGETLIQNNPEEAIRLSTLDSQVEGIPCSKRVLEVARAYFRGIQEYFLEKNKNESPKT